MQNQLPCDNKTKSDVKYTFGKKERLCSQKKIDQLFTTGYKLHYHPFRLVYSVERSTENQPVKFAVSVPKKLFKRAVKRNYIKRLIREAYRHNKYKLYEYVPIGFTLNIMLIYVSPTIAAYREIETKLVSVFSTLAKRIEKNTDIPTRGID